MLGALQQETIKLERRQRGGGGGGALRATEAALLCKMPPNMGIGGPSVSPSACADSSPDERIGVAYANPHIMGGEHRYR